MVKVKYGNIYTNIPTRNNKEVFQGISVNKYFKIERIISSGQATKKGKWLKESYDEWVVLLKGAAELRFRKGNYSINLKSGDYVLIPRGTLHRVEWTDPKHKTLWLAVYNKSIG